MRRALAIAALGALLAIAPASGQTPGTEADANRGRLLAIGGLFGELRLGCVQCHGLDGAGNASGAFPRLADQSGWYLYKSLVDYAAGLRPNDIMGPIARTLTDRQMQELAAHYAAIRDAPYPARPEGDARTLQAGGAISAIGLPAQGVPSCRSCHGEDGGGGSLVYPNLGGQFAPYLEHQLKLWKQGRRDGDAMNVMELIAKAMTDEQIRAVSLYYSALRPRGATSALGAPSASQRPAAFAAPASTIGLPQHPEGPNMQPPYLAPPVREGFAREGFGRKDSRRDAPVRAAPSGNPRLGPP
jgi:cytochrome c553